MSDFKLLNFRLSILMLLQLWPNLSVVVCGAAELPYTQNGVDQYKLSDITFTKRGAKFRVTVSLQL